MGQKIWDTYFFKDLNFPYELNLAATQTLHMSLVTLHEHTQTHSWIPEFQKFRIYWKIISLRIHFHSELEDKLGFYFHKTHCLNCPSCPLNNYVGQGTELDWTNSLILIKCEHWFQNVQQSRGHASNLTFCRHPVNWWYTSTPSLVTNGQTVQKMCHKHSMDLKNKEADINNRHYSTKTIRKQDDMSLQTSTKTSRLFTVTFLGLITYFFFFFFRCTWSLISKS